MKSTELAKLIPHAIGGLLPKNTKFMRAILFIVVALVGGCKPNKEPKNLGEGTKLFVCNEGNFGWGNADFDLINTELGTQQNQMYKTTNGHNLGDVLQSATEHNGNLYLVVNNSGKIVVVDKNTFKKVGEYTGFNSPRYLQILNDTTALVTELYKNWVYKLNLRTGAIETINLGNACEKMARLGDKIVLGGLKNKIYFYSTVQNKISDSISTNGPADQLVAANNSVFVLVSNKQIYKIDDAGNYSQISNISGNISFNHIAYNTTQQVCLLQNSTGIYQLTNGTAQLVFAQQNSNFYNFGVNKKGQLAICDAKNYTQKGSVYVLNEQYQLQKSYTVGIIPGEVLWLY